MSYEFSSDRLNGLRRHGGPRRLSAWTIRAASGGVNVKGQCEGRNRLRAGMRRRPRRVANDAVEWDLGLWMNCTVGSKRSQIIPADRVSDFENFEPSLGGCD